MNHGSAILALLGRILLASIFVYSGFGKITDFQGTAGYIASARMPMPQVLAIGAIVVEFIGGLALLIGFRARWAALAFVVFLIIITPIFHNFWSVPAVNNVASKDSATTISMIVKPSSRRDRSCQPLAQPRHHVTMLSVLLRVRAIHRPVADPP